MLRAAERFAALFCIVACTRQAHRLSKASNEIPVAVFEILGQNWTVPKSTSYS